MPRGGKAKKVKYKGKTYSTATSGGGASPRDIARAIQLGQIALQAAAEKAREEELRKKNLEKQQEVARASENHKATWGELIHGTDAQGRDITARIGTGTNKGHVALSDGHKPLEQFRTSGEHDHYGAGAGPHNNGTARSQYNGVGSRTPDEEAQQWEREHGY